MQGEIRQPIISDPISTPINGQPRLTAAEVASIINFAADRARITRAGIRLPIGTQMQVFITVVNFPNNPTVEPTVLGAFRTGEATLFSWDVAVQKGRTAVGFSTNSLALSTRSVGFLAQSFIRRASTCRIPALTTGSRNNSPVSCVLRFPAFVVNTAFASRIPRFPNGITIFPGGFPLYRNGQLIGAIGISGDGVDQDDIVGASGTHDFLAPFEIRADQFPYLGARLPYAKFPRDPTSQSAVGPPPFVAAAEKLANISTRVNAGTGENQLIGGFIVTGTSRRESSFARSDLRSLPRESALVLADPTLELHDQTGALIAVNDNWTDSQQAEIEATGIPPENELESAIVRTLAPGAYTAVVRGKRRWDRHRGGRGVRSKLRRPIRPWPTSALGARLDPGSDVMIGGFIIFGNGGNTRVLVRSVGPSLASSGIRTRCPIHPGAARHERHAHH